MTRDEFQKAIGTFQSQYGMQSMGTERVKLLWEKYQASPPGILLKAVESLIYKAAPGVPNGDTLDNEFKYLLREHYFKHPDQKIQPKGCDKCRQTGLISMQGKNAVVVAACDCPLGESYRPKIDSATTLQAQGFEPVARLNSQLSSHPNYQPPKPSLYGGALAGLFTVIQRAALTGDKTGVDKMLARFNLTREEAWEAYKDMRGGKMTDLLHRLRARGAGERPLTEGLVRTTDGENT